MFVVDKASSIPYYDQLAEILRREISEKQVEGDVFQLPSENELAEQHGLSRATVRHALDKLEREGWIYRQKGVGSFAVVRRVEQELARLDSTTQAMRLRGWSLVTRVLSIRQMAATHHIERALELKSGETVYELCRLRIVDDMPLSLQTAYMPVALCPRLEENDLTASLYGLLESRYGLRLWTGQETLRARKATPSEAQLLSIGEEIPVLYTERITYAANGAPVEYLEAVWRGDRYDFKVTLSRPG
jgi:GntR family transcriptional regulator, N-acetylglucosamine utilization regulator